VEIAVVQQNAIFPGLISFFNDGNLIADEAPSPLETSGHGDWVKTGPNETAFAFVFLIGSTEPGQWLKGTVSGTAVYESKTDEWSASL
jgi:hypothetical protein